MDFIMYIWWPDYWHADDWHGGQLACGKLAWRTIGIDFFNCFLFNEKKQMKNVYFQTHRSFYIIFS